MQIQYIELLYISLLLFECPSARFQALLPLALSLAMIQESYYTPIILAQLVIDMLYKNADHQCVCHITLNTCP